MLVKRLDVYHYSAEQIIRGPTWQQIEESIRRLDRDSYPWVWLRLTEEATDDDYMTVMGGEGAYWLSISVDGYDQRRLFYPEQGPEEVVVWTRDQGFSDESSRICFDIEAVVHAASVFAETADFDTALKWEPKERLGRARPRSPEARG